MKIYQVLIEVQFEKSNEVKAFSETDVSFREALKNIYKKIDEYNHVKQGYKTLCILKSSFNDNKSKIPN